MTSPWLSGLGAGLQDFAGSLERSRELDAKKEMAMAELAQKDKDRNQWKYIGAIDYGDGRGPVPSVYNQEQGQTVPADRIPGSYHGGGESPPPTPSAGDNPPAAFTPPSGADWTKALRVPAGGPTAPPAGPPSSDQAMAQLTGSTLPTVPRPSAATLPPGAPAGAPASFSTSGIPRVPVKPVAAKAPLLGTAEYNDAEVAKQNVLARARQSSDSAAIVNLAPLQATADSLKAAKVRQAEQAAGPAVPPSPEIVQGTGLDGKPAFFRVNKAAGPATPVPGLAPKPAASATNQLAIRANAALPQMEAALKTLDQYNEPGAAGRLFGYRPLGGWFISPEGQIANQAAEAFAQAYEGARSRSGVPTPSAVQNLKRQLQVQPGEGENPKLVALKIARFHQMRDEMAKIGGGGSVGAFDDLLPKKSP